MFRRSLRGLGLFLVLSLFLTSGVLAESTYPSFGPQTYDVHKYYYFGDDDYPATERQAIDITVDPSSVSYQSVKAVVTMDYNLIDDRDITKFIVLANGVNVDEFEPYFDTSVDPPVYREYYYLDVNVTDQYIGSQVYFQVVGLHEESDFSGSNNVYVVAWSQETPTVQLKPLPTSDSDTHGYLASILELLSDLKSMLEGKLDQLTKAVEDIYTPSPAAEARFDNAVQTLADKLPTKEFLEQTNSINDSLEDSLSRLETPGETIKLGGRFRFIPELAESEVDVLDLTELREQVILIRTILEAMLWVYFFHMLLNKFTPRLNI